MNGTEFANSTRHCRKWWLYIFYATIVWAIGYVIAYPAWPLLSSYTPGVLGWTSRGAVTADLEQLQKQQRAPMVSALVGGLTRGNL